VEANVHAKAAGLFDYICMRMWISEEVGKIADAQEFMDTLVSRGRHLSTRFHKYADVFKGPEAEIPSACGPASAGH
jgi:hypothetical protein